MPTPARKTRPAVSRSNQRLTGFDKLSDDRLQRLIDDAEGLGGEIAAIAGILRLVADSEEPEQALGKLNLDSIVTLAERMEEHADEVIWGGMLAELYDRQRAREAGGAR